MLAINNAVPRSSPDTRNAIPPPISAAARIAADTRRVLPSSRRTRFSSSGNRTETSPWSSRVRAESIRLGSCANVASDPTVFSADDVAQHATAEDCWTIVDGNVYDVTPFASRHPGGLAAISQICGVDGTVQFSGKHGSDSAPNSQLESLKIGTLGTP